MKPRLGWKRPKKCLIIKNWMFMLANEHELHISSEHFLKAFPSLSPLWIDIFQLSLCKTTPWTPLLAVNTVLNVISMPLGLITENIISSQRKNIRQPPSKRSNMFSMFHIYMFYQAANSFKNNRGSLKRLFSNHIVADLMLRFWCKWKGEGKGTERRPPTPMTCPGSDISSLLSP